MDARASLRSPDERTSRAKVRRRSAANCWRCGAGRSAVAESCLVETLQRALRLAEQRDAVHRGRRSKHPAAFRDQNARAISERSTPKKKANSGIGSSK